MGSEMELRGKNIRSWCDGSSLMVDPLSYFSFHPVPHDWCNKGRGVGYPVCGMYIKEPLLLIGKSSPCGGSSMMVLSNEYNILCFN